MKLTAIFFQNRNKSNTLLTRLVKERRIKYIKLEMKEVLLQLILQKYIRSKETTMNLLCQQIK